MIPACRLRGRRLGGRVTSLRAETPGCRRRQVSRPAPIGRRYPQARNTDGRRKLIAGLGRPQCQGYRLGAQGHSQGRSPPAASPMALSATLKRDLARQDRGAYRRTVQTEEAGSLINMPRDPHRRPDPKMTAVIAGAVITELVTVLNWLSQYSGDPLRGWQIPALSGATLLTGWIFIANPGPPSKWLLIELGLPKNRAAPRR